MWSLLGVLESQLGQRSRCATIRAASPASHTNSVHHILITQEESDHLFACVSTLNPVGKLLVQLYDLTWSLVMLNEVTWRLCDGWRGRCAGRAHGDCDAPLREFSHSLPLSYCRLVHRSVFACICTLLLSEFRGRLIC
eukprot:COSAG02_NODE_1668_length_11402_cov_21.101743_12_plen_138_part_00